MFNKVSSLCSDGSQPGKCHKKYKENETVTICFLCQPDKKVKKQKLMNAVFMTSDPVGISFSKCKFFMFCLALVCQQDGLNELHIFNKLSQLHSVALVSTWAALQSVCLLWQECF